MSAEQPESIPQPTSEEQSSSGTDGALRSSPESSPSARSGRSAAGASDPADPAAAAARKRRRGSRGGKNRRRPAKPSDPTSTGISIGGDADSLVEQPELPDPPHEGQVRAEGDHADILADVLVDSAVIPLSTTKASGRPFPTPKTAP